MDRFFSSAGFHCGVDGPTEREVIFGRSASVFAVSPLSAQTASICRMDADVSSVTLYQSRCPPDVMHWSIA